MYELKQPDYIGAVATTLSLPPHKVKAAIQLLQEGNTIPFIARYRKEMTGELDENQLRDIDASYRSEESLFERKSEVLRLLQEQGVFNEEKLAKELLSAITIARTLTEVDDVYRPYRPKRKTRASIARERGLEPLLHLMKTPAATKYSASQLQVATAPFVSPEKGVTTIEDAWQGAADIYAEEVSDDATIRKWIRDTTSRLGLLQSVAVDKAAESVYESYYKYEELLAKVPPHRVLAMNRGERENFLRLSIVAPVDEIINHLTRTSLSPVLNQPPHRPLPETLSPVVRILYEAIVDAYKRLIAPAIERELRNEWTEKAEDQAVVVFGKNLENLLMQPPIRGKSVLGVDPAYRTGCKLAVVDETGKLLEVDVIYPTPPQSKVEAAKQVILRMLDQHKIELISIGNGTASRETEAFIADCVKEFQLSSNLLVPYVMVSEAGASVYSASKLAGEEFPDLDVSERSAASIARRLQDPLAELVKIDPKAIGVGQYQHDVSAKRLDEKLSGVVESVVNRVGVDVNTASPSLLAYVSGISKTLAKNIVEFRELNGRFLSRKEIKQIPRMGPKTYEQCVGFFRVFGGEMGLDATAIHPESYTAATKLLSFAQDKDVLIKQEKRIRWIQELKQRPELELSQEIGVGVPTLRDMIQALEQPGRDPREEIPAPILRTDVLKLEDIQTGMVLQGTVRNVVDFGAFVDSGIKNDGLVHISELANRFVKHPMDVVSVGDIVSVRVIGIDTAKGKVSLSMKQ